MNGIFFLVCAALLFMVTSGDHLVVTQVPVPSTAEFISTQSDPGHGGFFLASEDLSNLVNSDHHPEVSDDHHSEIPSDHHPEVSDDHHETSDDHHQEIPDHHEISDDHPEVFVHPETSDDHHEASEDHSEVSDDHSSSVLNATNLNEDLIDRAGMVHENLTEVIGNSTETTTIDYHTETEEPVDLTVTDANGCFTALRDDMEEKCYDKFQEIVVGAMGEAENKQVVCCAVEDYEKCSLRGYQKTHCEGDKQSLKESLKAARLFMAAISNVSCSEHRGRCDSAASAYTPSFITIVMGLVTLLICL